ncbi:molybdopterin-dependent oxidoreductase [Chloroflexota bacterium]
MSEIKASEVRTYCAQCCVEHPVICEIEHGVFSKVKPDPDSPYHKGHLCEKGLAGPEMVYHPDRLNYPLKRTKPKTSRDGGWVRISWDEAYDTIVKNLNKITKKYGAESVLQFAGAPGGGAFVDDMFWVHRFANLFGTPNRVETGIAACEFGRDTLSALTFGMVFEPPPGSNFFGQHIYPDIENTACMMCWGYSPRNTENEVYYRIVAAKKRGAKLIVVDPRRTELAENADMHMQIRPGTDPCLAMGMINLMITRELYDKDFVRDWTNGPFLVRTDTNDLLTEKDLLARGNIKKYVVWDENSKSPKTYSPETVSYKSPDVLPSLLGTYKLKLASGKEVECKTALKLLAERAAKYTPQKVEEITWIPAKDVEQAAIWMTKLKRSCIHTFTGVEQNTNVAQGARAIHVMYALTGNFDLDGGTVSFPFPVPLIGDYEGSGDILPHEQHKKRIKQAERPLGVSLRGYMTHYDAYEAILTGKPYPIKGGMGWGANHLCIGSDALLGRKALQQLEFVFWVELFMTPTAEMADIVLPAASFWECPNVVGYGEIIGYSNIIGNYLKYREPPVPPLYERKGDLQILCELSQRFGFNDKYFDAGVEACLNGKITPSGYTAEQVRQSPNGIYFKNILPRFRKYAEINEKTGKFKGFITKTKKMEIYSTAFRMHGYDPLPEFVEPMISPISQPKLAEKYPLILIDARRKYMTQSQCGGLPSIRKHMPYAYAEIHPDTAKQYGIDDGDIIYIETRNGKIKQQAKVTESIHPRVVCATFGWWQGCPQFGIPQPDPFGPEGSNYSIIIDSEFKDPITGSYPLNGFLCTIEKAGKAEPIV